MNLRVFIFFLGLTLLPSGPGQTKEVTVMLSRSLSAYVAAVKGFKISTASWEYRVLTWEFSHEN